MPELNGRKWHVERGRGGFEYMVWDDPPELGTFFDSRANIKAGLAYIAKRYGSPPMYDPHPRCPYCNQPLVEVDNPLRREVRHRRGEEVTCPGPPTQEDNDVRSE